MRYQVEPELRGDVYVEGPSDKRLLRWIFDRVGLSKVVVYEIDTVDIPDYALDKYGLTHSSKRNLVIAFARELAANVPTIEEQAAFLIDRDLDEYFGTGGDLPSLFRTDFTSAQLYMFEKSIMHKFLAFAARVTEPGVDDFMNNVASELTKIFLVRLANASLEANLCSVRVDSSCSMRADGSIFLDRDDYLARRLSGSRQTSRCEEFKEEIERLEGKLFADPRFRMHGHDLVEVLYWFSRESPGRQIFRSKQALETALLMALDVNELMSKQQLANILAWTANTTSS